MLEAWKMWASEVAVAGASRSELEERVRSLVAVASRKEIERDQCHGMNAPWPVVQELMRLRRACTRLGNRAAKFKAQRDEDTHPQIDRLEQDVRALRGALELLRKERNEALDRMASVAAQAAHWKQLASGKPGERPEDYQRGMA